MKKLDVDKHTGPLFAVLVLFTFFPAFIIAMFGTTGLVFVGSLAVVLSLPWWSAYLWNKFIANEDEYYD